MHRKIVLEEFCEKWAAAFARENDIIQRILGSNLIEAHHIGSTSIPEMRAKPIIDILPVVRSIAAVDQVRSKFEEQGLVYRGEFGIPGRRYVVGLADDGITHRSHFHIFEAGDPEIPRHLFFRDYLRINRGAARRYEALKMQLQVQFEFESQKYQQGKASFCDEILSHMKIPKK